MKTITITIEDFDEEVLKHDIVDVRQWAQDAVNGKINSVKNRALKESQSVLIADPDITEIPATVNGSLSLWFSRPYYQNREQRISGSMEQ